MEDDLKKIKMEDDLIILEDDLKKNGRRPKKKWKTNQSTKINLIGCDTIVNSPSILLEVKEKVYLAGLVVTGLD